MNTFKSILNSILILCAVLVISGCNLPGNTVGVRGPRAWIDKPLDGTTVPLGPVEVLSHGSDSGSVTEMVLLVNGEQVRADANIGEGRLATFNQVWGPDQPGVYRLEVLARNAAGGETRSQSVTVTVGGEAAEDDALQSPTATYTPTTEDVPEITATFTSTPPETACTDLIDFAGETVPDDTIFQPGAGFTKSWTLTNAGTCTWTTGYALTFLAGDRMDAPAGVSLPQAVAPGESITLSVNMTAPNQSGSYRGNWMLADEENQLFGLGDNGLVDFWVQIVVQNATATPTTAAPEAPQAPSGLQITSSTCDNTGLDVTLEWTENADNENGYRVYRDGTLTQTLGTNVTSYSDSAPNKASAYSYAVEAFNDAGSSPQATVNSQICPIQ